MHGHIPELGYVQPSPDRVFARRSVPHVHGFRTVSICQVNTNIVYRERHFEFKQERIFIISQTLVNIGEDCGPEQSAPSAMIDAHRYSMRRLCYRRAMEDNIIAMILMNSKPSRT
jgi:hypothetical protein